MEWVTFASKMTLAIRATNIYFGQRNISLAQPEKPVSIMEWTSEFANALERSFGGR